MKVFCGERRPADNSNGEAILKPGYGLNRYYLKPESKGWFKMITATFYGLLCVLLLRWVMWGTLRLFEQEEELNQLCSDRPQESQEKEKPLSHWLHNGLSE
jgi:hypothetical protein